MGSFIQQIAYRYRDNILAKIFVRPFFRLKRYLDEKKRNNVFRKNAEKLLIHLKETLDSNNVFFWLEFGTLLGAYREHDFIKHDLDLDIGTFFESKDRIFDSLSQHGFKLIRQFIAGKDGREGFEQTYIYEGVTIDVFFFHRNEYGMYCNTFSHFPEEHMDISIFQVKKISIPYNGFSKMLFKGLEFNIPAKPAEHLQAHYGKDFMVPNAHFDYRKEATNIYYYSREERIARLISWE